MAFKVKILRGAKMIMKYPLSIFIKDLKDTVASFEPFFIII